MQGPGGMLALQVALLWSALALFASALRLPAWGRALVVLFLGLWPPLLAMQPHVWKDLWTLAGFAWALALLARDLGSPHRGWRAGAVLALVFACAFRHNAITGALPLLAWIAWREWPGRRLRVTVATFVLAAGLHLAVALANLAPGARDTPAWPVIAMWDIAAVSIAQDRVLFPPDWVEPGLTVQDLRQSLRLRGSHRCR